MLRAHQFGALAMARHKQNAARLVGTNRVRIFLPEQRALMLFEISHRSFISWMWSPSQEQTQFTSWAWWPGKQAAKPGVEQIAERRKKKQLRMPMSEDDPTLTRERQFADSGSPRCGGLHSCQEDERRLYTLEEVMSRSLTLRGGSLEVPFTDPGQRAFLTLNALKLNARMYLGRPLEADYIFIRTSRGKPQVLGLGMSGPVRAVKRRVDGRTCALKSFKKSQLDEKQMRMLRNEAQIFLEVDHPNIVRLMGCYEDTDELHFVMECCSGGEIYKKFIQRHQYDEFETIDIVRQMLFALLYLHENSLVHRDLKLENWMFEDTSEFARVKLIDFGLSRIWNVEDMGNMSRSCGTINYMAPEVLESKYGQKADLWSLGVIVFMLLSGKAPFYAQSCDGFTRDVVASSIREGAYDYHPNDWKDVSPEAKDFVEQLLQREVSNRMDAHQALAHPWLQQARSSRAEGVRKSRRSAKVDVKMIEGWRRFADFSAPLRIMLVELAFASRWTEGSMRGLQELFAEKNPHRGTMDFTVFQALVHEVDSDLTFDEIHRMFLAISSSRGGTGEMRDQICYSEFLAASLPCRFEQDELFQEVFKMIDINRDGRISLDEFMAVLGGTIITEEETQEFLSGFDGDGDGLITLDEFSNSLASKHVATNSHM